MNEPYKVPKDHKVFISEETIGRQKHTHIFIHRPDGTLDREIIQVTPLPSWISNNEHQNSR
jgi:hypothetical protein